MKALIPLAALALAGCVYPQESALAGDCNAEPAQKLVGKQASDGLLDEARRLSGAETARYLRPGQIVTMEYNSERVNLRLDAQDKVEAVTCG